MSLKIQAENQKITKRWISILVVENPTPLVLRRLGNRPYSMLTAVQCMPQTFILWKRCRVHLNTPARSGTPRASLNLMLKPPWHKWPWGYCCKQPIKLTMNNFFPRFIPWVTDSQVHLLDFLAGKQCNWFPEEPDAIANAGPWGLKLFKIRICLQLQGKRPFGTTRLYSKVC